MPRRAHKKSRNGCAECKRRHIKELTDLKCDEKHPICSHCITSERPCFYIDGPSRDHTPTQRASSKPRAIPKSPNGESIDSEDVSPVNMMHVELLHHLTSESQSIFCIDSTYANVSFTEILKHCLSAPYLMDEALAISSLHLSITRPDQQQIYRYRASHMQTHALSIFNTMKPEVNMDSCIAVFMFSSLLGIYMLCDTLVFRSGTFDDFLDSFTQYIRVHQGVRAVINGSWDYLRQTELGPFLNIADSLQEANNSAPKEFENLLSLTESVDMEDSTSEAYHHAIMSLQGVMAAAKTTSASPSVIIAWPVIVKAEYIDLLSRRQPEALVILAHYAVLLHSRRDHWIFGDGGGYIIESINMFLGPAWATCLSWPNESLQQEAT
ncbi:transcriptional regulator family: Fungal Specific TF [Penicillium odoratum]|uniref:transcriptional regulator family: Fungal Specific TF n=1 Tax=Penicillium odoratum TaxID=1167516 RepID=UPI0025481950|nr:transcriptional regulator family: Fungal Specific TF [Penicillium odoratum]KAJ5752141.1 transcriptional regulator family: Fungal Specific TF [Penicillium odoratum]